MKSGERVTVSEVKTAAQSFLKDSAAVTVCPITQLINFALRSARFPNDWKHAKVTPAYNAGAKDDPDNYRPISVLPIISKISENAVYQQQQNFLEENRLLCKFELGFRRNYSAIFDILYILF